MKIYGFDRIAMKWMKSFLEERTQMVSVSGKMSSPQHMNLGTPQGSRMSPILFLCLMADMDLWAEDSIISNFADDTQSIIIRNNKEEAIEATQKEANNLISFFTSNNLVNNSDKAAILYNSNGKGSKVTIKNIGNETINSTDSEKLLGLHISSDFCWNSHVHHVSVDLKKKLGLLMRIKHKVPKKILIQIADSIFISKIRYGISVYLNPIYEKEELKMRKLIKEVNDLQVLQNNMVHAIFGLNPIPGRYGQILPTPP